MKKLLCLVLLSAGILDANELESKCNKGKFETCVDLGMQHYNNKDYVKAKDLWIKACDGENADGCFNLGVLYDDGHGVKQDYFKAKELYAKACNGGNAGGCSNLGALYYNGLGVRQDKRQAKEYYGKACVLGSQPSCDEYKELNEQGY